MSHETIYLSLFVQARGALRKELTRCLRTGRARRRPRGLATSNGQGKICGMVNISQRPAEASDRAVPGHWEGDLLSGTRSSTVATLVERKSRLVMLAGLPGSHTADVVADALAGAITSLPGQLRRSLTGDQGKEMAAHARFSVATGVPACFCDPHPPWQRGSNENTYWCRMSGAGFLRREKLGRGRWVTRRTRAERLSVDMSTAARRARALTGSDLIEAC